MKRISFLLVLVFPFLLFSQSDAEVRSIVEKYRVKYNVPAVAASVINFDKIYFGVSGVKKTNTTDKVEIDSKFHLGSNTKAITSLVAAILVEDGLLDWNTKLVEVVPEIRNNINKAYTNITLQDLLSHRARIAPFEDDKSKEWRRMPIEKIESAKNQKLEFAKYALNLKPSELKETNHLYSNGGYIIAALLLEKASGKSWEQLVQEYFDDIGINHFIGFPSQKDQNDTYGHIKRGKKYNCVPPKKEYELGNYFAPAGNLSLSIKDFSKLIQQNLQGLMGNDGILKPETYKKLHFGLDKYALGWYNGNIGDSEQKFSYHGGSLGTFSSAVIVSADRKIAIVILVNADNGMVDDLKSELRVELWDTYGNK